MPSVTSRIRMQTQPQPIMPEISLLLQDWPRLMGFCAKELNVSQAAVVEVMVCEPSEPA